VKARARKGAGLSNFQSEAPVAVIAPVISTSIEKAVGVAIAFGAHMAPTASQGINSSFWQFVSNTGCWIRQDSAANLVGTPASAGNGSMYVPPNTPVILDGINGDDLGVIQDTAPGKASLTKVRIF
jgi:hypothetical protein